MDPETSKAQLRSRIRSARSRATAAGTVSTVAEDGARTIADAAWDVLEAQVSTGGAIIAYAALSGEPDLDPVIDRWLADGGAVYLPVVTQIGRALEFGQVTGSMASLAPRGRWGIREPDAATGRAQLLSAEELLAEAAPELIFVPALGFGADGVRLGNGGGFYDRTFGPRGEIPLRSERLPCTFGVCFADELDLPGLVAEDWDLRIGAAVTENGLHTF